MDPLSLLEVLAPGQRATPRLTRPLEIPQELVVGSQDEHRSGIPVVIAALNALQIDAVTGPASNMLNTLLAAVPAVFAAAIVLVLSYMVGRVMADLVSRALAAAGFNRALAALGFTGQPAAPGRAPSAIAGQLVLAGIILFAAIEAAGLLGFTALQALLASFLVLAGHVLLGLVVFGIGLYLADLAARAIRASGATNAGLLASAARVAIIVLTGAMALRQMGLERDHQPGIRSRGWRHRGRGRDCLRSRIA